MKIKPPLVNEEPCKKGGKRDSGWGTEGKRFAFGSGGERCHW